MSLFFAGTVNHNNFPHSSAPFIIVPSIHPSIRDLVEEEEEKDTFVWSLFVPWWYVLCFRTSQSQGFVAYFIAVDDHRRWYGVCVCVGELVCVFSSQSRGFFSGWPWDAACGAEWQKQRGAVQCVLGVRKLTFAHDAAVRHVVSGLPEATPNCSLWYADSLVCINMWMKKYHYEH